MALAGGALASSASLPGDLRDRAQDQVPLDTTRRAGRRSRSSCGSCGARAAPTTSSRTSSAGRAGLPVGAPSAPAGGWQAAALDAGFRVLLLDQRGTGSSTPVTAQTLRGVGDADAQAAYSALPRRLDCEGLRGGAQALRQQEDHAPRPVVWRFCIPLPLLRALAIERALFTFGLAPSRKRPTTSTAPRSREWRSAQYYARYPGDVELVRSIVRKLDAAAPTPRGGTLTARRFLQLGLLLGSGSGLETLHDLLEHAFVDTADGPVLADGFLLAVEAAQQGFETNPIYWLLHEAIYCEPGSGASAWAAERVQASLGDAWDYKTRLKEGAAPVLLTGEMVYSWMGTTTRAGELKPVAEARAEERLATAL